MKLTTEELKKGEVYFISYGYIKLIARFKEVETTDLVLYSEVKIYSKKEKFYTSPSAWCVRNGIEELRPAAKAEKAKLEKYEAENGVEYKEMGGKYQDFFNFLNEHFGITPTETGMEDIIQEALKVSRKTEGACCDSPKVILMTGAIYLEPDSEPYESGKQEDAATDCVNRSVCARYCESCKKLIWIYED